MTDDNSVSVDQGQESPQPEQEATISPIREVPIQDEGGNLQLIMDIPLRVTVELGRTKMAVRDLLNLGQGSVVELNKLAGEPLEVLVNNKLIARGEVVVVNEKFGVRLLDIISPRES